MLIALMSEFYISYAKKKKQTLLDCISCTILYMNVTKTFCFKNKV